MNLKKLAGLCAVAFSLVLMASFTLPVQALIYQADNQSRVLGDSTASFYPYPTGTLVNDSGTIYFISGITKVPFTSWQAFVGLGYAGKTVVEGDLTNYALAEGYTINSANATHPWGSWLIYKGTVYYSIEGGLIGVPSASAFTSNGGDWTYIVKANKYDVAVLNANPNLPPLTANDSRVYATPTYQTGSPTPTPTPASTPTPVNASPTPTPIQTTPTPTPTPVVGVRAGQLVNINSTVYFVGPNGLYGIPSLAVFNSWGWSFSNVLTANSAEQSLPQLGLVPPKQGTCSSPLDEINGTCGTMSNASQSVNVVSNAAFTGGNELVGTVAQKIGSYLISASAAEGVYLSSVSIEPQPTGGPAGASNFQNLNIKVNGNQFGQIQAIVDAATSYTFTGGSPIYIQPNGTAIVDVYADISSTYTGTSNLYPGTVLTACTGSGTTTGTAISCNNVNGQNLNFISASASSSLNVSLNSAFSGASYVALAPSNGSKIGSFTITAPSSQSATINSLTFTPGNLNLINLRIIINGQQNNANSGTVTPGVPINISLLPTIQLSAGQTIVVDVYADITNGLASSAAPAVSLSGISGNISFSGSVNGQPITVTAPVTPLAVISSTLNPAFTGGTIASGLVTQKIGSFIVNASFAQAASLNSLSIGIQPNGGVPVFQNLVVKINGVQFGFTQPTVAANSVYPFSGNPALVIPANTSVIVDVYADILTDIASANLNPATFFSGCTAIGITNSASGGCSYVSGQSISISGSGSAASKPSVSYITPTSAATGQSINMVIIGSGFLSTVNQSGNALPITSSLQLQTSKAVSDNEIDATYVIAANAPASTYQFGVGGSNTVPFTIIH